MATIKMTSSHEARGGTQPAFGKILCGVDDSRPSAEAARQAIALATPGGSLDLIAVSWNVGTGPHAVSALNVGRVEEALEEAQQEAAAAGLSATRRVIQARDPAKALLEESAGHDLIAVGSHSGSRGLAIVFGSTASSLVHRAHLPVLVARQPLATAAFPGKVLFATDGSRGSHAAARLAGRIAAARDSELIAVHVDDSADAEIRRALARETVELLETTGREPAFIETSGDAHKEINRLATELGAGLVIVGSSGRGGLKALGSVSEQVAQGAPCSVLVARPPA